MAELISDMLQDAGAIVVGSAQTAAAALALLESQAVDLACLDIQLGHEDSFCVADYLTSQRIPFVFVTACRRETVPERHRDRPFVSKMDIPEALLPSLVTAHRGIDRGRRAAGSNSCPMDNAAAS